MKGRILKIKTGCNPNSSSVGADIIVFFSAGAAVTILFNVIAAIVGAAKAQEEDASREGSKELRQETISQ